MNSKAEMKEWRQGLHAVEGQITAKNYDAQAAWYGVKIKHWADRGGWPFLSRDPEIASTADESAWLAYFSKLRGGYPPTFRAYIERKIRYLNVPEKSPGLFDTSYKPSDPTSRRKPNP